MEKVGDIHSLKARCVQFPDQTFCMYCTYCIVARYTTIVNLFIYLHSCKIIHSFLGPFLLLSGVVCWDGTSNSSESLAKDNHSSVFEICWDKMLLDRSFNRVADLYFHFHF